MKKTAIAVVLMGILTIASASLASDQNGIGAGIGMSVRPSLVPSLTLRARALSVTPLELEYSYLPTFGQEVNLNLYLLHTKYFKFHMIDPGLYVGKPLNGVNNLDRKFDIALGAGAEVTVWKRLVVFINAKVYLPDPSAVANHVEQTAVDNGSGAANDCLNGNCGNPGDSLNNAKNKTIDAATDSYKTAIKNYQATIGVMWFLW